MGSYAYCRHPGCQHGLDSPKLLQLRYEYWECPEGHNNVIRNRFDILCDIIDELTSRVSELERIHSDDGR